MRVLPFLVGPTASGKSQLAMQLAEQLPIEILSLDSALVYRGMDIGTAKPNATEQSQVRHHLIDTIDPTEQWSIAQFAAAFQRAADEVVARGNIPLAVGGTMMYAHALMKGLSDVPPSEPEVRAQVSEDAARLGWLAMHVQLQGVDPITASRLAPTDAQRISRALEVWRSTGQPLSALQGERKPLLVGFAPKLLALVPSEPEGRVELHSRIAKRFDAMISTGLLDEVRGLQKRHSGLSAEHASMRCVGYRQAWQHLSGELSLAEFRERGIIATRQLAKRQITWLRALQQEPETVVFDMRSVRAQDLLTHLR